MSRLASIIDRIITAGGELLDAIVRAEDAYGPAVIVAVIAVFVLAIAGLMILLVWVVS